MARAALELPTLPFEYEVVRSRRKTLAIHVKSGIVTIQAPQKASSKWISEFLTDNISWAQGKIKDQRAKAQEVLVLADGHEVPFLGKPRRLRLVAAKQQKVELHERELVLHVQDKSADRIEKLFSNWLLEQARAYMPPQTERTAKRLELGHKLKKVVFRKTRSKWGHCEDNGIIQYNQLVMMAPQAVIDYLIVHETCHLRHLDHSPRFWKAVGVLCPDYKIHREWLNKNGHKLWTRQ